MESSQSLASWLTAVGLIEVGLYSLILTISPFRNCVDTSVTNFTRVPIYSRVSKTGARCASLNHGRTGKLKEGRLKGGGVVMSKRESVPGGGAVPDTEVAVLAETPPRLAGRAAAPAR